ncbi:MAG: hypothetical protein MUE42_13130, partial [Opitutaceae bacterium]|nr:hypothetical protein [Opitutaceae bacterium]
MKLVVGLTLAAIAWSVPAQASPGRMDVSKRASRLSTEQKATLPEAQPLERNEVLMERRFDAGEPLERKEALVGERRAPIAVEETREKTLFATPEQKKYDVIERKDSPWAGKKSRFSTTEDTYRSKVAIRFQDQIGKATPFNDNMKTVVSQETTFDKINRFAFRKNADQ